MSSWNLGCVILCLIFIDLQNDYFPGGRKELDASLKALQNIQLILNHCRKRGYEIIFIKHIALKSNAPFFIEGTEGSEIHRSIKPAEKDHLIIKHYPNAFRETDLHELLTKSRITNLVFTGMMTHMCVDTTVRAAFDLGYNNILISDCCATVDLVYNDETVKAGDVQNAFLAALKGTFCSITATEEFIK